MWYFSLIGKNRLVDFVFRKAVSISIKTKLLKKLKRENSDYYIICRPHPAGFFSDYFYVLGHMMISDDLGLIPYVDMKNYPSLYSEENGVDGILNSWEYYFRQFDNHTLETAYGHSHLVCEEKYPYSKVPYYSTTNLFHEGYPTKKLVAKLNKYINKYIVLKDEIREEFEREALELNIGECVGVHIRGTDMKGTQGHIIPIGVESVIKKIEKIQVLYDIKKIFLCTDEESIKNRMEEAFEGKIEIVSLNAYRSQNNNQGIHLEKEAYVKREKHKYNLGLEVLKDVYLLSRCRALVCGNSNVAYASIVFNNNQYEWVNCE